MALTSAASNFGRLLEGPVESCFSPGKSENSKSVRDLVTKVTVPNEIPMI